MSADAIDRTFQMVRLLQVDGVHSRMRVGAVVLAAGAGSRLGGCPKALLELDGVPLVVRQVIAFNQAGVDDVVIVTGHHAERIEAAVHALPVTLAHNRAPDDGQSSSLRIGLQALPPKLDAVIIALADQPMIGKYDIAALIDAFMKRGDASMVVPCVPTESGERLPGNPVIIDASVREEWLAHGTELAGRNWRLSHPERVRWFETDNRHYRIDIDTPDDLKRFEASTGHRLQWPAGFVRDATSSC